MNKTAIKNFAIWARNKLITDIGYRAGLMGITEDGIHSALPQSTGKTEFYDIGTAEPYAITGEAIRQRRHLVELIQRKEKDTDYKTAYKYIIEEVAYTWFNRLIAVRFMEVNDYLPSHIRVLSSDSGKLEPDLVTTPFDAELEFTRDEQQTVLDLKNANKLDEVFRILFIKQCNALNDILPALFEKTNDYTELLLNLSVIDQDGVVYHLIHDISEEDFDVERGGQVEIIGWMYQYYNTEPKDEAFALLKRSIKITKERIPAATQLFTPDWIVRYMVENSLGRLWVEGHPNDDLKAGWKYYLEEAEQKSEVQEQLSEIREEYAKLNPEDIKLIDPCMGSGHILVYAFDVLMQIYESAGYGQRDAARSILENNLYGLDIDDRAFQIAYFALMMKARQYNRRILNGESKPNLYAIQESNEISRDHMKYFGRSMNDADKNIAISQIDYLIDIFKDAKEYGSILKVDKCNWDLLNNYISFTEHIGQLSFDSVGLDETSSQLKRIINQARLLSGQYEVVVTNPPYMGSGNMNVRLSGFLKTNYPDSKADLSTVFMEKTISMNCDNGFMAMINIPSWMFITSFEQLRAKLANNSIITTMNHFGRGIFGSDFGTTSFVIKKTKLPDYMGLYFRLFKKQGAVDSIEIKEKWFLHRMGEYHAKQSDFNKITGKPIAYWANNRMIEIFDSYKSISDYADVKDGFTTGDNEHFLKVWFEVSDQKCKLNATGVDDAISCNAKWFPYNKGGSFRKWFGNQYYVINWENNGRELKSFKKSVLRNQQYAFREGITWTLLSSSCFGVRITEANSLFDTNGKSMFPEKNNLKYIMALLSSKIAFEFLRILNPTMAFQVGDLSRIPIMISEEKKAEIEKLSDECLSLSKQDWDMSEISWNFKKNPLVADLSKSDSLSECYCRLKELADGRFLCMKGIEESLNSLFLNIYDLEEYYDPRVEERDITIYRIYDTKENLPDSMDGSAYIMYQKDLIVSLLSYAVGCMFGRYSLDVSGLAYAGGDWDISKYTSFLPDSDNVIPITDEEYLEDDIVSRLCSWLKVVYGESTLEDNLDFIAKTLGNKGGSSREIIRNYFLNDFFKDHCQTYSVTGSGKRPIYWLFDSGKQNGFKALVYLHRYNADTIGILRIDYLHRMQRVYESEIIRMQDMIDHSTNAREIGQATKRRDKLTKQLKECREYDEKLAHLALSRIELDLDDGVKVNYRKIQTANDGKFYEVLADSKRIMSKK